MKLNVFLYTCFALVLTLFLNSCCTKSDKCSITSFSNITLRNFSKADVSGQIQLIEYQGGSSFANVLQSFNVNVSNIDDSANYVLLTPELSAGSDYEIIFVNISKTYRIKDFTVERISCGKCIMKNNNQFGYKLNGYSINGQMQSFDNGIVISK